MGYEMLFSRQDVAELLGGPRRHSSDREILIISLDNGSRMLMLVARYWDTRSMK